MKVLLTHELFPPDYAGGGEYGVLEIARHLMAKGVSVRVLTTGNPAVVSYEGIPTVRIAIPRRSFNFALTKVIELARDVDVIHTFNYHACLPSLLAGKWLRKPVVCTFLGLFHTTWKEMRGRVTGTVYMAWEKFLVSRKFSRVIFLTDGNRRLGIALGAEEVRSFVNNPGIVTSLYTPAPTKENGVLFVGKLEVRKGVYDVIEVAKALPDVVFRMIGWGPEEANLRKTAPPNVELLQFENGATLRNAFSRATIFFLPSRAEGFPYALLEAMASGCAVVCTLPLDFEGVQVPTGDRRRMIEAIATLWYNRESTDRMGRRNVQLVKTYTWERHASSLLALYIEVMREHKVRERNS